LERLVSSSEAARILGLSLQGIHYRIKNGKLKSTKQDGKTFVYLDELVINPQKQIQEVKATNINEVIVGKNDQIILLKKSLKAMRNQYKDEIQRLEKSQENIILVFQSEISLLQSAFNEMRNLYQLGSNSSKKSEVKSDKNNFNMMTIQDFFIFMKQNNKSESQIKAIILEKIREEDKRFIYNKKTKEVLIYKSDFLDLI